MVFANKEDFKQRFEERLWEAYEKSLDSCTLQEKYNNLVHVVKDSASEIRTRTSERHKNNKEKKVYYFSMEFLIGKLLNNYLINLGIRDIVKDGLADLGEDLDEICAVERDPGLGNGGLGRLAACFLDSMASLGISGVGMGLRYHFGLFRQKIESGYQVALPDAWLSDGYPWEEKRSDAAAEVRFGGYIDREFRDGKLYFEHKGYMSVRAIPYDVPIIGFNGEDVNVLHLWDAKPVNDTVDMDAFNAGEYALARKERSDIEAITCILYPEDSDGIGRKLRLKQEYFLVSAGLSSIIRRFKSLYGSNWQEFPERVAIHINDTHPTLCIPELMRRLMDEEGLEWDEAWDITVRTMSFTNHTVLPEALEKWSIDLFRELLPRVYMIVEEIDRRWRDMLYATGNFARHGATAVLWDGEVRMANLSIIGSHSVNGVAALHSEILKNEVFRDFYAVFPDRFNNKTNGISHRRFLIESNPGLASLITGAIGEGWKTDMQQLSRLRDFAGDEGFLDALAQVKRENKLRLADFISRTMEINVDPDSVFDIQVKRIHAYKRQLLNALKVLHIYNELKKDPSLPVNNYTFIFAGKAAQGYTYAKEIIKFINSVADTVNSDPDVNGRIKVVFIENFCVSNAQLIYPAAEISEQISTAGKEASGTGNMKFMMNGAVTLGTLDGANVEIKDHAGRDNIRIFGLTAEDVMQYYRFGGYSSFDIMNSDEALKLITSQLVNDFFQKSGCNFWGIYDELLQRNDEYFVLKDFRPYVNAWLELGEVYRDRKRWQAMSLANIAGSYYFTSDRTIREYAGEIWHL